MPVSWHSPLVALSSEVPPVQVPALEGEAVPMVWLGPPGRQKKRPNSLGRLEGCKQPNSVNILEISKQPKKQSKAKKS